MILQSRDYSILNRSEKEESVLTVRGKVCKTDFLIEARKKNCDYFIVPTKLEFVINERLATNKLGTKCKMQSVLMWVMCFSCSNAKIRGK